MTDITRQINYMQKKLSKRLPLAQLVKGLFKTCLDASKKHYTFYFTANKACG
jgi:hypothetical protein